MSQIFAGYTECSVSAFEFNPKYKEIIDRKQEILDSINQHYGTVPTTVLFYGFNPIIMGTSTKQVYVTYITPQIKKFLDTRGVKYTYVAEEDLGNYRKSFDWVVATDEYFTFAKTEEEQQAKIQLACNLAKNLVITTLRDYKNQDFRDREFSQPLAVRNGHDSKIFLEYHDYDYNDKNAWKTTVHEMSGADAIIHGPYARRSMYFKQMANFSITAGARQFYVHKNLMYKSLIKKNYEHVISISF
jgi:hypothetical protein